LHTPERGGRGDGARVGDGCGVEGEEEVLEPPHVAIEPDPLAAVPERVRRAGAVLVDLRLRKEPDGLGLGPVHGLRGHAVVHGLEEAESLAGVHDGPRSAGAAQVDHRHGGEVVARARGLQQLDLVDNRRVGEHHHNRRSVGLCD
jgi:hypothetical protein